jgi:hypothetical protein
LDLAANRSAIGGYLLTVVTIKGLAGFWSRCPAGSLYRRLPTWYLCGCGSHVVCVLPGAAW